MCCPLSSRYLSLYVHMCLYIISGSKSYVYDVEPSDIDHLQLYTTKPGEYGCQDESAFHFLDLMRQNHKEMPSSSEEALAMYRWLMNNV